MTTTENAVTATTYDCRKAFAEELIAMAGEDPRIVAVCNDSVGSSNLVGFREAFPDRLINVGIAEQDLVGVGAGLANGGMIPFVSAAAPFLTGRALEQIKADVAYSRAHVVLCGQSPGMAYGELGPTHHSIEDLSWIRAIPGMKVIVPADPAETRAALRYVVANPGAYYLRIGRHPVPAVNPEGTGFELGRAVQLADGEDIAIIAVGSMVSRAVEAAKQLGAAGIAARVLNMSTIEPLDIDKVLAAGRETRGVITVEEAIISGGLGAAVASVLAENHPTRMRLLGLTQFAPTGSTDFLLAYFGLTADGIVAAAHEVLDHVGT